MAKTYIIYNSFDSRNSFTLKYKPVMSLPKKQIEIIDIIGRNGSLVEDYNSYQDIVIKIDMTTLSEPYEAIKEIVKSNEGWLQLSWKSGFYKVKNINDLTVEQIKKDTNVSVELLCEPFRYSDIKTKDVVKDNPFTIGGALQADYKLVFTATGDASIFINNEEIQLKNCSGSITFDTKLKLCYNQSKNIKMIGDFPKLIVGENTINWNGSISSIQLQYREVNLI